METSPPPDAAAPAEPETRQLLQTFKELGASEPIKLQGMNATATLYPGLRRDELVTRARLRLRFASSPSLLPELSHIKLLLNGEIVATLPLSKEQAGREQQQDVELDPLYFSDNNQIQIQLVGHYSMECEDARHSSIWVSISNQSSLELTLRPLALHDDLAQLPMPFFDSRDTQRQTLPFVFAPKPSQGALRSAGVVASWFGALADYRGISFPVFNQGLPNRHAVVFATNQDRIAGLPLPPVEAATLTMMSHPSNPAVKLLLVLGRDDADLKLAADALALSHSLLSGQSTVVHHVEYPPRRQAYDAPAWIPTDRPVKLGELASYTAQLQVDNYAPQPLRLNLRPPADLFDWRGRGIRLDLKYRYTPPAAQDSSTLDVSLNDRFLRSFRLKPAAGAGEKDRLNLSLQEQAGEQDGGELSIPSFRPGDNNQLQFRFAFDDGNRAGGARCNARQIDNVRGAIDPESTIDLTPLTHYVALPDLAFFANSGFPFTKYADLAETSVVLPDRPSSGDIEIMLALLGHMGKSTGAPALGFRLIAADAVEDAADTDLLIVDASSSQKLLNRWQHDFPAVVAKSRLSAPIGGPLASLRALFAQDDPPVTPSVGTAILEGEGSMAALVGFESPLRANRSVVAVMGSDPTAAATALTVLEDKAQANRMHGDVAFIRYGRVETYRMGDVYYVGRLAPWAWLWFHASRHPLLLALSGLVGGLLLSFPLYWAMQLAARKQPGSDS